MDITILGERPAGAIGSQLIAERVSQAIISGALPVGTEVRQQELADHFGVSRMPVREALRVVEASGLLQHRPYRSPVVVGHTIEQNPVLAWARARIQELEQALTDAKATHAHRLEAHQ